MLQGILGTRTCANANASLKNVQPTNGGTPRDVNAVAVAVEAATSTKFALVEVESTRTPASVVVYLNSAPMVRLRTPIPVNVVIGAFRIRTVCLENTGILTPANVSAPPNFALTNKHGTALAARAVVAVAVAAAVDSQPLVPSDSHGIRLPVSVVVEVVAVAVGVVVWFNSVAPSADGILTPADAWFWILQARSMRTWASRSPNRNDWLFAPQEPKYQLRNVPQAGSCKYVYIP